MSDVATPALTDLPKGLEVLSPFVDAMIFGDSDVQVAGAVARTVPGTADDVLLATALCVRALQLGHVCVELDRVAATVGPDAQGEEARSVDDGIDPTSLTRDLPWPEPDAWADALRASDAVAVRDPDSGAADRDLEPGVIRPLVFDGRRVYLERYWRYERRVGDLLLAYAAGHEDSRAAADDREPPDIDAVLDRFFGPDDADEPDRQRQGARMALDRRVTVLAGGPGTGKTHVVARLLATAHQLALDDGRPIEIALAAPTGKAAARLTEAVHQAATTAQLPPELSEPLLATEAGTIHRLLGYRDGISFRHDHDNPLRHDLVVIDESSMVALPLMARLLDALRPEARLVLVGDPFQLASVEAGAVLGDVVGPAARSTDRVEGPLADNIVVLRRVHRFAPDSAIAALADAVREGDTDRAIEVLRDPSATDVDWIDPADTVALDTLRQAAVANATEVAQAALDGDTDAALERVTDLKLLCGTRFGPMGSYAWRDHIERQLARRVPRLRTDRQWYVGRPVIITANDYITRVFNGDTGVVVDVDGRPTVAMPGAEGVRTLLPSQLDAAETWWAMTIHKSQGSEFTHAVVSLPDARSRILTNELLYTGLTRGQEKVTVVAGEDALRTAIETRVARASGLGSRLWP